MTDFRSKMPEKRRGGYGPGTGFSLNFVNGRGVLTAGPLQVGDAVTIDNLELLIPDLTFPFDLPEGVFGLRHRRMLLGRLEMTVFAAPLEILLKRIVEQHAFLTLRSLWFEEDFVQILVSYGGDSGAPPVPLSFRLVPQFVEDKLVAAIENPMAFGPLGANLLFAAAVAVEAIIGIEPEGVYAALPDPIRTVLFHFLPPLGWRLPDFEAARLLHIRLYPDRVRLAFAHPELDECKTPSLFENEISRLALLKTQEENHIARTGDRFVTDGRITDARDAYARLLDRDPDSPFAIARLAMLEVLNPELVETAVSLAESVHVRHPERADLTAAILHGVALQDKADEEIPLLRQVSDTGSPLERFAACMRLAELLIDDEPKKAAAVLEQALSIRREDPPALFALIRAWSAVGDTERVLPLISRWVAATPRGSERANANAVAGDILLSIGRPKEASRYFDRALLAAPRDLSVLSGTARAARERGDLERAVRYYERLDQVARESGAAAVSADALFALGELWLEKGEPSLAMQRFDAALEINPENPERRIRYAILLREASRFAEAARELETALKTVAEPEAEPWYASAAAILARLYLEDLEDLEAARYFARTAARDPGSRIDALEVIREAVRRGPLDTEEGIEHLTLTQVRELAEDLRLVGDSPRLRRVLEQASVLFPEDVAFVDELIALVRDAEDYPKLLKIMSDRVETVVSAKRRAELELELGRLNLNVFNNPSAALCWFKNAYDNGGAPEAGHGMEACLDILNRQAEHLLEDGDTEAAETLFAVIQKELPDDEDLQDARLDGAQKAFDLGEYWTAHELAVTLLKSRSEIRKRAALLVAKVLKQRGELKEAVAVLEETAKGLSAESAVPLLLFAIDIAPKAIVNRDEVLVSLKLNIKDGTVKPELDQAIAKLLAVTGDKIGLAEYLTSNNQGNWDPERLRRAARLFTEAGRGEKAVRVLERLYHKTRSIGDLFLLADGLKRQGEVEVLIGILEERRQENPRIAEMLRQELATYSAALEQKSVAPIDSPPPPRPDASEEDATAHSDVEDFLQDKGGDLDRKLKEAFDILRKKT